MISRRKAGHSGSRRPLGAIASRRDGTEADAIDERDYDSLIERMMRLAKRQRPQACLRFIVEPTPMRGNGRGRSRKRGG